MCETETAEIKPRQGPEITLVYYAIAMVNNNHRPTNR